MVRKFERNGKVYYICEICNVAYVDEKWARKCTEWCSKHRGTCSIEIVKHSVQIDESDAKD